jgi:hypothetical protein
VTAAPKTPSFVAPRELPGLWVLHLPPGYYLVGAAALGAIAGPLAVRLSSDVTDIALRLSLGVRLIGVLAVAAALGSGWQRPGPRAVRLFSLGVVGAALVGGGLSSFLGEKTPPLVVDVALAALFAALPLYLRRVRLTEPWVSGSIRPALACAATALAFLPAAGLALGFEALWRLRAAGIAEDARELAAGLRRLAEQGTLPEADRQRLAALAGELPGARSLWLAVAAVPPGEAKAGKRRVGEVEEAIDELLAATQDLFLAPRAPVAAEGAWEVGGAPNSAANKKHFAKAKAYWEGVREIVAGGELLAPFIADGGNPYGLAPDPRRRPQSDDAVGRVALFRGEVASRLDGIKGAIGALDGDAARLGEALASRAALEPYPDLAAPLLAGVSGALERGAAESWGKLRLSGVELLDFWGVLALEDPARRLGQEARCFKDKPKDSDGKRLVAYSCPAYDLTAKDPATGLVVRAVVLYDAAVTARAEQLLLEVRRPAKLPEWKKEVLSTLKRRGIGVAASKSGDGYELEAPSGNADQTPLVMQFTESGDRAGLKITRAPKKPAKAPTK